MVEVERAGSITKAAANLFMGQPNLSKAIKEVENEIGVVIFKRSAKGVVPTEKGAEFLEYARAILLQLEKIESLYKPENSECISFSISVPRASYICHAFTEFVSGLPPKKNININFKETNSVDAVDNVADGTHNLAVIRYGIEYEEYFLSLINEKGMRYENVLTFEYQVLMSRENPLASYDKIPFASLGDMTEIIHGDLSVPYLSGAYTKKNECGHGGRRIYVYERGSQFDLLRGVPTTYMWVSPMPREILDAFGLVAKKSSDISRKYKDILVCGSSYKFTDADEKFLEVLYRVRDEVSE